VEKSLRAVGLPTSGFEWAVAIDVAAQYHKKLMRTDLTIRYLVGNGIHCSATGAFRHASRTTTRQSGAGENAPGKLEVLEMMREIRGGWDWFRAQMCR
jgi:hypothetical protein